MKLFRLFLILLATNFLFTACEKDGSFEAGIARGALQKDLFGECLDINPIGTYNTNTVLNANNYVDVQIVMSEAGSYVIKTDTVNGYSFSDVGIAVVGLNTLRLKASGTPVAIGINTFKINFDGTTCNFDVSVSNGPINTVAVFTFAASGTPSTCSGSTQNAAATFMQGIPTNPSNWVDINVNVISAGTYNLNTGTLAVNGVKYSGSGTLASGNQTVRLIADGGTPTTANTFNYSLNVSGSNCGFDVVYQSQVAGATFTVNCLGITVLGSYQAGTLLTSSNTIVVPLTVTAPGSCTLSTNSLNGVVFSGSKILTATPAIQFITLYASPSVAPTASGPFSYTIGTSSCTANVIYLPASGGGSATNIFKARIGSATAGYTSFNFSNTASGYNNSNSEVKLVGSSANGPEDISLLITKVGGSFVINTDYNVNQFLSVNFLCDYQDPLGMNFISEPDPLNPPVANPLTIRFSVLNSTKAVGTFSGNMVEDPAGTAIVSFFSGEFDITF
jgi:hypothetical protein